ncbi:MAG: helix-turn-helix transcriptional regulator [Kiritimatiellia bacterium]
MQNIGEGLSNKILAREASMSLAGFERMFKRHYGCSPARYVTENRIREASHRLLQSDESIDVIADAAGFPNRAYFSRVFKKVVGESPAAFRCKSGSICRR